MIKKLSTFAEIYDSEKLTFRGLEEVKLKDGKMLILKDIHLWINKDDLFENYILPDLRPIDLIKKKFLMVRFLGPFCEEHQVFHGGIINDNRIRYYAHYVLSRLAPFVPLAKLKAKSLRLTVKKLTDVLFVETNTYPLNEFDLSEEDYSQSMSEITYQSQLKQLKAETELISMQVKQFRQNIDQRLLFSSFLTNIDHNMK
jgi:hypothetical protein